MSLIDTIRTASKVSTAKSRWSCLFVGALDAETVLGKRGRWVEHQGTSTAPENSLPCRPTL